MTGETWTVGRLLGWTTDWLGAKGSDSARLDAEVLIGPGQREFGEEHIRQSRVVVLAGMDEYLVGDGTQGSGHCSRLHELWPVADHRQDRRSGAQLIRSPAGPR